MSTNLTSEARPVSEFLSRLALAPRQSHKLLTVWPLVLSDETQESVAPTYVTLSDAIEQGAIVVDEVSEGGQVPHVRVENRGDIAVLGLFGEEIRGAKQNRIANASFLVEPRSSLVINVSCVEHGRWGRRSGATFSGTGEVLSQSIRRKMSDKVSASRASGRGFTADQGEVWKEIAKRVDFSATRSDTGAYADYVATRRHDLDEVSSAFHLAAGQVGFVAAIGDEMVGLEAIGRAEVFARAFSGLLRAYMIDAIDAAHVRERTDPSPAGPRFDSPEGFIQAISAAPATVTPSLGLGYDFRLSGGGISGCALVAGEVVHLTAFPATQV